MFGFRRGAPLNVLALLCLMSFLLYVDRVNLSTAAGPLMKELGFTNTQLGLAFSAFGYSYLVFQLVGGWLADRIGPRRTLLICGVIWVITTLATSLVQGFASLFAVRLILGIGEGATLPAAARAIVNWTPVGKRSFVQGLTHSFSRLGNAVTPPIVAFLTLAFSWRASFVVLGLLTAVWVAAWWLYFRDDPRNHPGVVKEDLAGLPELGDIAAHQGGATPWGAIVSRIWPTMLVYFCYGWTAWLFFTWLPVFFQHGYGMDLKSTAAFASAVFISGVFGDTVGGMLSDRILRRTGDVEAARRNVILVSFLGAFAFLMLLHFSSDFNVKLIGVACAFFMIELTIGPIWAVPMDVAPRYAGIASGFVNAGAAVAGIVSPIVFGLIIDRTGNWTLPFAGSACVLLVGALATFLIKPQHKMEPVDEPSTAETKVAAR
jgi:MFS family permease